MPNPNLPSYELTDSEATALKAAVQESLKETSQALQSWNRLCADMYSGRDPSTGAGLAPIFANGNGDPTEINLGASFDISSGFPSDTSAADVRLPKVGANLILSRIRQRVTATTPGIPRLQATAITDGAVRLTENQQDIFDSLLPSSNIEDAMERVAFLLPTQSYVGLVLKTNHAADHPTRSFGFEAVESSHCGYEPYLNRFQWYTYSVQFGSLDKSVQDTLLSDSTPEDAPEPWSLVGVTEVYHAGFSMDTDRHTGAQVPASLYVRLEGDIWHRRKVNPELGKYVHTQILRGPVLAIAGGLDPAPNEAVPMPEVLSWLPLMRSIGVTLQMIQSEVQNGNSIVIYDEEALRKVIHMVANAKPGQRIYLPAVFDPMDSNGVSNRMRPIEQNSTLPDLIATLNLQLALFDDVTGVGPLDRGSAVNPEKSATEASALVAASSRRNADAIKTQARLWSECARLLMLHQRDLFGDTIRIPQAGALVKELRVPDPLEAPMNLRVDPVAFENQGRQGKIDTEMLVLTTLTNTAASLQNPNAMRMVNESLRRFLKAVGWKDADDFMDMAADPISRYVEAIETGGSIPVLQDDNHAAFITGYQKILERAAGDASRTIEVDIVSDALQRHQLLHKESSQGTRLSPVPGVSPEGQLDNQTAASAAVGTLAAQTRQTLGG